MYIYRGSKHEYIRNAQYNSNNYNNSSKNPSGHPYPLLSCAATRPANRLTITLQTKQSV